MATIQAACQNCGSNVSMGVSQHLEGKRMLWSAGYSCPRCKHQGELDDQGEAPTRDSSGDLRSRRGMVS